MQILFILIMFTNAVSAKELAFTFDDAPVGTTKHFQSEERTLALVNKIRNLKLPSVMTFANPCKRKDTQSVLKQLRIYTDNGHRIGNHTCSHPRLDDVGYQEFTREIAEAESHLAPLLGAQKFFRFPYLNEGSDAGLRDRVREFLAKNDYRNGAVSIDNDDSWITYKVNEAAKRNNPIDYEAVKRLLISHIVGAADYYDRLAVKELGYSPKHVLLLHEVDMTVMFFESLVAEFQSQGWKIIDVDEAYRDQLYQRSPKSIYANNGIIAQVVHEQTGERKRYAVFNELDKELNRILGL